MLSLFKKIVIAAFAEDAPVAAPKPMQPQDAESVDIRRLYTAISIELNEQLRAIRDLIEAQRESSVRAEQVFSWLARLDEDFRVALRSDVKDVRERREVGRTKARVPDYEHKVLPMKEGDAI